MAIISSYLSWKALETRGYLLKGTGGLPNPDETLKVPPIKIETPEVVHEFLQRPILSYDEVVELNKKTCPTEGVNFDGGAVVERKEEWGRLSPEKISYWRKNIAEYLTQKEKEKQEKAKSNLTLAAGGEEKEGGGGRGIVMAAGDHVSVIRARTNIRLLRSYNCSLPIEIFNFPDEISGPDKRLLEELSVLEHGSGDHAGHNETTVTIRVAEGVRKGQDWKAFHIKAAAIQQSSFDEILYLDTDSYALRNPEDLFESKEWKDTGLMLWPDYTKSHATNPIWRLVGQQCRNEYEGESGQIYISRVLHQDVLWVAEYFALRYREFYGFLGGDRDSFRAAALLLGKKWTGPGRLNAAAGVVLNNPQGGGHTMLQADPEGKWMFVHANLIKHAHFNRPLWSKIHRAAQDQFTVGSTYGDVQPPNDALGNGVKLRVVYEPMMSSVMNTFEGYDDKLVVVEDWNSYEELKGFEEKWFGFGGVH